MAADPTSPVAPAFVRILLLPVGTIKSSRFATFVKRLEPETHVRLGDISPDAEKTAFSPLAFPNGIILYSLTTALPPPSHIALSPFETFREPFIVICIGDGAEYSEHSQPSLSQDSGAKDHSGPISLQSDLHNGLDKARGLCPRALLFQVLLFDYVASEVQSGLPAGTVTVPKIEDSRSTTMKTIMADISSHFLAELSTLARSIQVAPPLDLLYNAAHGLSTSQFPLSGRSTEPLRSSSLRVEVLRTTSPALNGMLGESAEHATESGTSSSPAGGPISKDAQHSPAISSSSSPSRSSVSSRTATNEINRDSGFEQDSYSDIIEQDLRLSQEQKSIHRTSQAPASEFANSRLKARQAVIIGTLYLHSGRWPDALRELADGASRARVHNDHMWYAKGLENILITTVLLAWAGLDFQIPPICLATPTKLSYSKRASSGSFPGLGDVRPSADATNSGTLQRLSLVTFDLSTLILNNYSRAADAQGEIPFQFAFSESVIRLAKLLSVQHLVAGTLDHAALQYLVRGTPLAMATRPTYALSETLFKTQLSAFLFKAYPPRSSTLGLSIADSVIILSGIASVLSLAGLERKRAIVNKQLLSALIPALANARKAVAAEIAIHPTGSLAVLQGLDPNSFPSEHTGIDSGFRDLLKDVCYAYGVLGRGAIPMSQDPKAADKDSNEGLILEIINELDASSYGSYHIRTDILRLCANVSDALPDFRGLIHYAAALLYAGQPNVVPLRGTVSKMKLSRDEQIWLSDKMTRTWTLTGPTEALQLEAIYWDHFLVRGIELHPVGKEHALLERSRQDFVLHTARGPVTGPFLYNSIARTSVDIATDRMLVAGERADFMITLQNPHDFDVVIENFHLSTEGVPFDQSPLSVVLGPRRMQRIIATGSPERAGQLRICGCYVKIKGCREQQFLIFDKAWSPGKDLKVKKHGGLGPTPLSSSATHSGRAVPGSGMTGNDMTILRPATPEFSVAEQQPLLSIVSTSLPQSTIAILHGETYTFSVTVRNISTSVNVDLINLSFTYSNLLSPSPALLKNGTEMELYDAEYESINLPPFKWRKKQDALSTIIEPGHSTIFDVEVIGKQNLFQCEVLVEYGSLGCQIEEAKGKFFTRQSSLPLTITVNPSIQLERVDIVPLERIAVLQDIRRPPETGTVITADQAVGSLRANEDEVVLLLLDVRNSWLKPLAVFVQHAIPAASLQINEGTNERFRTVDSIIQPGHIARFVVPLLKVSGSDFDKPIPVLNAAGRRQYVVDQANRSSEDEVVIRKAFWCREEIFKQILASWTDIGGDRCGSIDLRGLELSPRMICLARQNPLEVQISVSSPSGDVAGLKELRRGKFTTSVDEFLTFKVTLRNRTEKEVQPYLRIQPRLLNKLGDPEFDLSKCIVWTGSLQRPASPLKSGQSFELELGVCFLSVGNYEITAVVDDVQQALTSVKQEDREQGVSNYLGSSVCKMLVTHG